jgi:hypothetical protein
MPLDRPSADEIRRVLDHHAAHCDALPSRAFADRVAAHLEAILAREQTPTGSGSSAASQLLVEEQVRLQRILGCEGSAELLHRRLCGQIRCGALDWRDPGLMAHLRQWVDAKLAIDNPRYKG